MNPQPNDNPLMPRSYNGIPTFEKMLEHEKHDYDMSAVDYVQHYANAEYARAERIAADERLTPQAKAEDIKNILDSALTEAQERVAAQLETVERQLNETARKAQRPLSPKAEDVPQLTYIRDVLTAQARMKGSEAAIRQEWERALDNGDAMTLRVLVDFGESLIRSTRPKDTASAVHLGARFEQLRQRSEDALATPEMKSARIALLKLEATRLRLHQVKNATERRFKNARLRGNALVDSERERMFETSRRGW